VSEMNKCQHCGTFVAAEKAFCPNCSEPMEAEDTSHRAHSFSSDMMSTIRDDPEKYRNLLTPPVKKQEQQPAQTEAQTRAPDPNPVRSKPPAADVGFKYPEAASIPPPPANSNNRSYLILGISIVVILVLLFVILFAYKII
jgi:hypothetical protein